MSRSGHPLLLVFAVLLLGASALASAQGRGRNASPQAERQDARQANTLSDSVRKVERDTRGEVLSAERVPFDGRDVNRVKVVDDRGRVRVYMDDPGRIDPNRSRGERRGQPPTRDDDD